MILWVFFMPALGSTLDATRRPDSARTRAQLNALKERIERVSREVGRDATMSDHLTRNLRTAELAVAGTRAELTTLTAQADALAVKRLGLMAERSRAGTTLAQQRAALAAQLQVAYRIGPHESLQLLLNPRDVAASSRLVTWYGYFARARAQQIAAIAGQVRHLDAVDSALMVQDQAIAQLRNAQHARLSQLQSQLTQRHSALASLHAEAQPRVASLARLRAQQGSIEKLLSELGRVTRPAAPDDHAGYGGEFGRLYGRLEWPVIGHVVANFGEQRASGVRWDGMVIATAAAAAVHAVAAGRVIYADWLPGLGLLAIVSHSGGYLSLYGYNAQLHISVGETVAAGETIAAAGDTGGRSEPELFFEMRRGGKPIDPKAWFRSRHP